MKTSDTDEAVAPRRVLPSGVWGVVATPFHGSSMDADTDSLARLAQQYEAIDATGLTVLGVFGEAASLTATERELVLEVVADSCALPLVVGITALATRPAIDEVRAAHHVLGDRLAAVMVQANSADPGILTSHLQAIHRATGIDIVLQDYPVASGVSISVGNLARVVGDCAFICAVKSEAPPTASVIAQLSDAVDVAIFGGLGGQGLLDELVAGSAGAMTGFSYPEALVDCVRAWRTGGESAARAAFQPYLPLVNFEQQPRIALAIRKECLKFRGLIDEAGVRAPAAAFPEALRGTLGLHMRHAERALAETIAGAASPSGLHTTGVR
ncbi:dihydrodipicolinate synthase family protein [Arthrobacter sp.]|uniref:dihydrodipicolinate synthase family protein n=1 Tax=Arthrobacter sp. TaxID=1667 RepID=UPI003A946365